MPFDQTTGNPIGYAVTLAIQIFAVSIIGGIICLINTLFFGICWYVDTFIRDLIEIFKQIDELWMHKNDKRIENENENQSDSRIDSDTFSLFHQFFLFHEDIFR